MKNIFKRKQQTKTISLEEYFRDFKVNKVDDYYLVTFPIPGDFNDNHKIFNTRNDVRMFFEGKYQKLLKELDERYNKIINNWE